MSGAIKAVTDFVMAPINAITGGLFEQPEPVVVQPEEKKITGLTQAEQANIAQEEAQRKAKKAKSGTKTVLTSPLGATTTPNTAVTKLGG